MTLGLAEQEATWNAASLWNMPSYIGSFEALAVISFYGG